MHSHMSETSLAVDDVTGVANAFNQARSPVGLTDGAAGTPRPAGSLLHVAPHHVHSGANRHEVQVRSAQTRKKKKRTNRIERWRERAAAVRGGGAMQRLL